MYKLLQARLSELAPHVLAAASPHQPNLCFAKTANFGPMFTDPPKKSQFLPSPQQNMISHIVLEYSAFEVQTVPKMVSFLGNLTGKYDAIQQGEIDNGELRKYGKLNPGEI